MTTKLPVPAFADAVRDFTNYAEAYPAYTSPHAYTVVTPTGGRLPHDLIAHVYRDLGGDLEVFAGMRERLQGPTPRNSLHLPIIWSDMFTRDALFIEVRGSKVWGTSNDEAMAADLLTYWLFSRIQRAQDYKGATWFSATRRALLYMRRLILDVHSGFLVQTHGNHAHLVAPAIAAIDEALARLKR